MAAAARKQVEELLRQLREGWRPQDNSPETVTDQYLNGLCYRDFPALCRVRARLSVKGKDKKLDVFFRGRITAMVATLNFYLDPELSYSWQESSVLAAKALGRGVKHAWNLRKWIKNYLDSEKLPLHRYGTYHSSILEDEDFRRGIQLHLTEIAKKGYIRAQDIVDYVATPEVQQQLGTNARGIHVRTARWWLHRLSWRYQQKKKGMYIDGHECEDVVEYWKGFIERWKEYENVSSFTTTMEMLFQHLLDFLSHKACTSGWFWWHMMSRHFMKTTAERQCGWIIAPRQSQRRRERASQSWCLSF